MGMLFSWCFLAVGELDVSTGRLFHVPGPPSNFATPCPSPLMLFHVDELHVPVPQAIEPFPRGFAG